MSRRQGRRRTAVRAIKAASPDISLRVDRWAARADFVVIEWTITATFGGAHIELPGADRFTLSGDRLSRACLLRQPCAADVAGPHRRGGALELSR